MDLDCVLGRMKVSDEIPLANFFNNVGDSLLIEILGRLPSRAAIRLKSVCRRWRFLISSDYFMSFFHHRRHDPSLPPLDDHDSLSYSMLIQLAYSDNLDLCLSLIRCRYTTHGAKLYAHHRLDFSFLSCPQTKVELKASCDDLVVCSFKNTFFYVCNLLTRQWVALPPAPHFIEQAIGLLCLPVPKPCSINNCHRQCVHHKKFMVVRIHRHDELGVPQSKFKVQFFSSEEGEWRTRVVSSPQALTTFTFNTCYGTVWNKSYNYLVAHKGLLYWQICSSVVVFDPFNSPQTFSHVIDLPLESDYHRPSSIAVCRDRVCVQIWLFSPKHHRGEKSSVDIWELEDYVMGKWNLVHKHCNENLKPDPEGNTICVEYVHPDGNVLYQRKNWTVWLWNFECGEQYELIHRTPGHQLFSEGNILQIVDQWWPTPVPSLPASTSTSHN